MSRKVRLCFAAPLVVTLAVAPACLVRTSSTPPAGAPTGTGAGSVRPIANPPPPGPGSTPTPPVADRAPFPGTPADTVQQGATPAPASLGEWTVFQNRNDQKCYVQIKVDCPPKPATCNPPPPRVMAACPTGIAMDRPIRIVEESADACYVYTDPPACPPNVACNPPRPEPVACPS